MNKGYNILQRYYILNTTALYITKEVFTMMKVNNWLYMDLKNMISYIELGKKRDLHSNEKQELEEVKESLRKQGFKNLLIDLGIDQ